MYDVEISERLADQLATQIALHGQAGAIAAVLLERKDYCLGDLAHNLLLPPAIQRFQDGDC